MQSGRAMPTPDTVTGNPGNSPSLAGQGKPIGRRWGKGYCSVRDFLPVGSEHKSARRQSSTFSPSPALVRLPWPTSDRELPGLPVTVSGVGITRPLDFMPAHPPVCSARRQSRRLSVSRMFQAPTVGRSW